MQLTELDINATPDFRWPTLATLILELATLDEGLVTAHQAWIDETGKRIALAADLRETKAALRRIENGVFSSIADKDLTGKTSAERTAERKRLVESDEKVVAAQHRAALAERALEEAEAGVEEAAKREGIVDRRIRWRQQIVGALSTFTGRIAQAEEDPYVVGHDEAGVVPDVPLEEDPNLWPTEEPVVMPEDTDDVPF